MDKIYNSLTNIDDLELSNVEIPEDIIFPDELCRYLKAQNEYLQHENAMIKRELSEHELKINTSNLEINEYKQKLRKYENIGSSNNFVTSSQVASTKIVELSKKLREKNSEVESLRTKYSKLELYANDLKEQLENKEAPIDARKVETPIAKSDDQLKKTQEKLNIATNKILEIKNANTQLKNDLKLANKWLQQEIGEHFDSMIKITTKIQNWRGRAQIIKELQLKNAELKEKNKILSSNTQASFDISNIKNENKISSLIIENNELKTNTEDQKRKIETFKLKYRTLEKDFSILKTRHAVLFEKNQLDQNNIESLRKQITDLSESNSYKINEKEKILRKLLKENDIKSMENEQCKCKIENLSKNIQDIKSELIKIKEENEATILISPETKAANKELNRLEVEKSKLLELLEIQNTRLVDERANISKIKKQLRFEKQRAAKLETHLSRIELDQNSYRTTSYCSILSSKSSEVNLKDELELSRETIKALQTRLEMEQRERKLDLENFIKTIQSKKNVTSFE